MKTTSVIIIIFCLSVHLYSQEIGISTGKVWTKNYELSNPAGFGVFFSQPIWKFGLRLEYFSANNERNYHGYLVSGFFGPDYQQIKEQVNSKSKYSTFEISFHLRNLFEVLECNLGIGIGISVSKFECTRIGENSGREIKLSNDDKQGIFYCFSFSKENCFGLPVKLEIFFKHTGLFTGYYATDSDLPFIQLNDIKRLQLNLAYIF